MKKNKVRVKNAENPASKVSFPIAAKLVIIITILFFVSLGLITALVAFFVRRDIEKTAWENNISINEMSTTTAEVELSSVISKVSVLLSDIIVQRRAAGTDETAPPEKLSGFFFRENTEIAAIVLDTSSAAAMDTGFPGNRLSLYNEDFLKANNINDAMIDAFLAVQRRSVERVQAGEIIVLNAAPVLNKQPILALIYKWQSAGNAAIAAAFFSSEFITTSFGTGANSTILINDTGDLLVSADSQMIGEGSNLSNTPFMQSILESAALSLKERYKDKQGREFFAVSKRLALSNTITITTIPSDVVFEGINATTRRNIYLSIGVWFLSVLLLWFFAKGISNPLKMLTESVSAIENGNYHLRIRSKRQDETGVLTRSILSMSHVLENFESFTNKEIARLARQGSLVTTGSTKNITMFFSDIRSFTAISEKITPNEVIEFLNEYMERMVSCVMITGGAIDKFIGDAVMAYWGAVNSAGSPEKDALNGVKAALMMRASLMCFNKRRGTDKKPIIKIGCGLNSGTVVAGQIGSDERIVFTVIGETVSLADRTETLNKPFGTEILVTGHTHKLIEKYFITEKMGEITEKGEKLAIFAIINIKDPAESAKLLEDLDNLPHTDHKIVRKCVGPKGPQTLADLRMLIGIPTPDLTNLNLDEEEKKYKVKDDGAKKQAG